MRRHWRSGSGRNDWDVRDHHDLEIPLLAKDARNGASTCPLHMVRLECTEQQIPPPAFGAVGMTA